MSVINTRSFGRFWPVSSTINLFWGLRVISTIDEPRGAFWPILARFMDYYSLFWSPKAISVVVELQDVLTCRSSTITVWADSGSVFALLLYFVVSKSFPRLTNPGVRLRVGHQHSQFADSGPFRVLLLTVLGSPSDLHD